MNNIYLPHSATYLKAKKLLEHNELVVFPTETIYGLGANALSDEAAKKIFRLKGRPNDNPLIVHLGDKEQIPHYAEIENKIQQTIIDKLMPGPITLLLKKKKRWAKRTPHKAAGLISDVVCPIDYVGIRLPSNKIAQEFLQTVQLPIAAPSANISGKPSPTNAQMVYDNLWDKVPMIIDGGESEAGIESTVVRVVPTPLLKGGSPDLVGTGGSMTRAGGVGWEGTEKIHKHYIDYEPSLKELARDLRNNMTQAEKNLWYHFLSTCPYKFQRQKPIDWYIVDFFCNELKLIIEIDWDSHFTDKAIKYDAERTKVLEKLGFQVVRFTNEEIFNNFWEVCERIAEYRTSPTSRSSDGTQPPSEGGKRVEKYKIQILRPGFVTKEDLEDLFNHKIIVEYTTNNPELSPGMRYRHYSISGKVVLIPPHIHPGGKPTTHNPPGWSGEKTGYLITQEFFDAHQTFFSVLPQQNNTFIKIRGTHDNLATCAHNLFDLYHYFDTRGVEVLYVEQLPEVWIGYSIMNRVKKSAE